MQPSACRKQQSRKQLGCVSDTILPPHGTTATQ
jgi:hypothetical protein